LKILAHLDQYIEQSIINAAIGSSDKRLTTEQAAEAADTFISLWDQPTPPTRGLENESRASTESLSGIP
jgi:hypothetical protein